MADITLKIGLYTVINVETIIDNNAFDVVSKKNVLGWFCTKKKIMYVLFIILYKYDVFFVNEFNNLNPKSNNDIIILLHSLSIYTASNNYERKCSEQSVVCI